MVFRQDTARAATTLRASSVGVGLRPDHYRDALGTEAPVDFLEVHSENFFAEEGILVELLQGIAASTPVSLHGTAAGLGSAQCVPDDYLIKLKRLADRVNPVLISDHLCFTWASIGEQLYHGGDLLPIPYSRESLDHAVANIDRLQSFLGRRVAIENVCSYLDLADGEFDEAAFLNEVVSRTGCGLILDINNLMVNARNGRVRDPGRYIEEYVRSLNTDAVLEIHLAGSTPVSDSELLIDDHACPVSDAGWEAYQRVVQQIGSRPTLVEWDNALPPWPTLLAEATKAKAIQRQGLERRHAP